MEAVGRSLKRGRIVGCCRNPGGDHTGLNWSSGSTERGSRWSQEFFRQWSQQGSMIEWMWRLRRGRKLEQITWSTGTQRKLRPSSLSSFSFLLPTSNFICILNFFSFFLIIMKKHLFYLRPLLHLCCGSLSPPASTGT